VSNPKRQRQRRLERERLAIERRLGAAVAPNLAGPLLQGAPIRYEWAERDRGVAHGGIGMIARLVEAVGLASDLEKWISLNRAWIGGDSGRCWRQRGVGDYNCHCESR
jgi:hypothetical protein